MAKKKTAKKESKDLALKESKDLALKEAGLTSAALAAHANYDLDTFKDVGLDVDQNRDLFQNDILIPKIWLVQAMSELRKSKQAEEGDFADSQTGEVLAEEGDSLNVVILKTFKRWQTFKMVTEKGKTKKEFVSSEIMVLGKNEKLPYEETVDGEDLVRRQVISAYVLLERDVVNQLDKPYIIDFASSSKLAGRKMVSDINTLNKNNLPSFVGYFSLTSREENFNEGSAFVKDIKFGGYLPKALMPFLINSYKHLGTIENQIEIDDRDVIDGETAKPKGKKANSKVTDQALNSTASI